MEFGTFYQLPCAAEQSPLQRYEDTLMQIQHADSLGIDVAWLAELHFFPTFSIMPSPLLVASALAQRTHRIRLGIAVNLYLSHTCVMLKMLRPRHPQQWCLEYGDGRVRSAPFCHYNVALEESRERFLRPRCRAARLDHRLIFIRRQILSVSRRRSYPPLQKPHPPIRIACNSSDSFQLAGERGWRIFRRRSLCRCHVCSKTLLPTISSWARRRCGA